MMVDEHNLSENGHDLQASTQIDRLDLLKQTLLRRLEHLVGLAREGAGSESPETRRLISRSIYSTYCDCVDFGLRQEARELLQSVSWGEFAH